MGRQAFDLLSLAALGEIDRDAAIFGRRLGHLIATLLSEVAHPEGRSAWRAAYLRHWRSIEHIWLGGGVAAALGESMLRATREEAGGLGADTCTIDLAPDPATLALQGAAVCRAEPLHDAVAFDFGQTVVKRGLALAREGRFHLVERLADIEVSSPELSTDPDAVREFVITTIADTVRLAEERLCQPDRPGLDPRVVASVACYVVDGRPYDRRGLCAPLGMAEPRVLEQALCERTARELQLTFVHDGTAAARAVPTGRRTAVIMLGTALGVGFAP